MWPKLQPLEVLRGLAILLVVLFHTYPSIFPGGYIGVDVFLVVSGFVIFRSLVRRASAGESFSLGSFFYRRLRRLAPSLVFAMVLFLPLLAFSQSPFGAFDDSFFTAITSLGGFSNGVIQYLNGGYFGSGAEWNAFLHTWSLSVEIQFYLLFGLFGLIALKSLPVKKYVSLLWVFAGLVGGLSLLIFVLSLIISLPFQELGMFGYYSPLVRAWEFCIGGAAAILGGKSSMSNEKKTATGAVLIMFLLALAVIEPIGSRELVASCFAAIATAVLIIAVRDLDKIRALGLLASIGKYSYAWYVFHWPSLVIARTVGLDNYLLLVNAVSLLLSIWFVRSLEPRMLSEDFWSLKSSGIVGLAIMFPVTSSILAGNSFFDESLSGLKEQIQSRHAPAQHDWICATGPLDDANLDRCTLHYGKDISKPIFLIGDSQAGHLSEGLLGASKGLDRSLIVSTTTSCPFLSSSNQSDRCNRFHRATIEMLTSQPPGSVVIAFAYDRQPVDEDIRSFADTISILSKHGHRVHVVSAIPHFVEPNKYDPKSCHLTYLDIEECFPSMTLFDAEDQTSGHRMLMKRTFDIEEDFLQVDIFGQVCPNNQCSTKVGKRVVYRDPSHLSVSFSAELATFLEAELRTPK